MIVFLSNYYNHHQSSFSEAMFKLTKGEYRFIACEPMDEERKAMGWGGEDAVFALQYQDDPIGCQNLVDFADVVISGSAPYEYLKKRLKQGRMVLFYSERIYKAEPSKWKIPLRVMKHYMMFGRYKNAFLLCASAFTAADYALTKTFVGKTYKWGYFPRTKRYKNIEVLLKQKRPASILWVARFINWKHPEQPILVAQRLKKDGYKFDLNMIGNGDLLDKYTQMICDYSLEDCVHMLGAMKPEQVRKHMEESQIFLFTSDRNEGWGAVLNESMNSGCAVVASHIIGAVPFMLENGQNGLIYEDGNFDMLYSSVKKLLDHQEVSKRLGVEAYKTICYTWNADNAASRLLSLIQDLNHRKTSNQFQSGPCSEAKIIQDEWCQL